MLRQRAVRCRASAALAIALLLAAYVKETGALVDCYCSNDESCLNNTCSGNECGVELKGSEEGGQYYLQYRCYPEFLFCFSDNDHACCRTHNCNRCLLPQFNNGIPEGLNLYSILPPECHDIITLPTTPPTHSSSSTINFETGDSSTTDTVTTHPTAVSDLPGVWLTLPPWLYAIIFLGILVVFLCVIFVILLCWLSHRRRHRCEVGSISSLSISEMESFPVEEVTLSGDSGGFRHCRFLEPRTIGQQVSFKERLAKGGFGEVWRGDLNGEAVAVKVMSSLLEDCWKKEQDIYLTNMLHHESILRFIAVDSKIIDFSQKLIIIVEYHPHGSLYDYLSSHVITARELLKMMFSIINGISFLHMPVKSSFSEREKPAIAHRDIKTKNILVKRDGTCCVADFGLSVRSDDFKGDQKPPDPIKGTRRYMAPEILDRTINGRDFHSFVKVDIYSFGLVLWEATRRCGDVGEVGEYQVPYQNCVPNDPSIEDMKKVVVTQGIRPDIDERWKKSEVTSTISSVMQECWRANPLSRLSAFRIKKKLQALSNDTKDSIPLKTDVQF